MSEASSPQTSTKADSSGMADSTSPHVESPSNTTESAPSENLKPYACVTCSRRKVRCDKREPCSTCRKSGIECIFRAPAPPQARKRRAPETILLERLQRAEDLLKGMGVKVDPPENFNVLRQNDASKPAAVSRENSRKQTLSHETSVPSLVEQRSVGQNDPLWGQERLNLVRSALDANAKEEGYDVEKSSQSTDEEEPSLCEHTKSNSSSSDIWGGANAARLLLEPQSSSISLRSQHPPRAVMYPLWRAFLENVNPLSKIIHVPTVEELLFPQHGEVKSMTRPAEALFFGICASAVNSLQDIDCQRITGEPRTILLPRMQSAARQALVNARFLGSRSIITLQAFVLYLLSSRSEYDHNTLWSLTGVAVRFGQRLGLDREAMLTGLPVLEAEISRRTWFQIVALEVALHEIAGAVGPGTVPIWDTRLPLNLNDSDLDITMTQAPVERTGATEMFFCLLRYTFGGYLALMKGRRPFNSDSVEANSAPISQAEKDRGLDELERILGENFLRYSDPVETLHSLASTVARLAVCKARWIANHPRTYTGMSLKERDMLFQVSLRVLEYDDLICSNPRMAKYLWHTKSYFQWDTLIFLLTELQTRRAGEDVERAWRQIEVCYNSHDELITDTRPLHTAVRNLTMKAWNAREAEMTRRYPGLFTSEPPRFITQLRAVTKAARSPRRVMTSGPTSLSNILNDFESKPCKPDGGYGYLNAFDTGMAPFNAAEFSASGIPTDWSQWDALIQDPVFSSPSESALFDQSFASWQI